MVDNYYKRGPDPCPPKMSDGRFLTDHRSSNQREQHNIYINSLPRDAYTVRDFYRDNAEKIMDKTWDYHRDKNSCFPNKCCVHDYPTRSLPQLHYEELKMYNQCTKNRHLGKKQVPSQRCRDLKDYRATITKSQKWEAYETKPSPSNIKNKTCKSIK